MEKVTYELSQEEQNMIEDILLKLKEICQMLKVPMFATIAVANDENGTTYNSVVNGAGSHNMQLTNDQIRNHILIANEFEIIQRDEKTMIVPPKDKKKMKVKSSRKEE